MVRVVTESVTGQAGTVDGGMETGLSDWDFELREHLAVLGPEFLAQIEEVLDWPQWRRDALARSLYGGRGREQLATILIMCEDPRFRSVMQAAIRDALPASEVLQHPPDAEV
jgi:hypothetical protein